MIGPYPTSLIFSSSVPERASFQPYDEKLVPEVDEEEDDLPRKFGLQSRLGRRVSKEVDDCPPPIPERSDQPKAMMLRLMKSATNTLKS